MWTFETSKSDRLAVASGPYDSVGIIANGVRENAGTAATNVREEARLVGRAKEGDEDAFSELMHGARDMCLRVAISMLGNREDAVDEVQSAFWKAYSHLGCFTHQARFSTWVVRIVINNCIMRLRRADRVRFVAYENVGANGEMYVAHEPVNGDTPESRLGQQEISHILKYELQRVPHSLKTALELRYVHDLTIEEIAVRLRLTVPATKSRLHRAIGFLRDRMVKHCGVRGAATLTRIA